MTPSLLAQQGGTSENFQKTRGAIPGFFLRTNEGRLWSVGSGLSQMVAPESPESQSAIKAWFANAVSDEQDRRIAFNRTKYDASRPRQNGIDSAESAIIQKIQDVRQRLMQINLQHQLGTTSPKSEMEARLLRRMLTRQWLEYNNRLPELRKARKNAYKQLQLASYPRLHLETPPFIATLAADQQRLDMAFLNPPQYRNIMRVARQVARVSPG